MDHLTIEINYWLNYFDPSGIKKERESPHSPHSILYAWNNDIQTAMTMNQKNEPIAENITSVNKVEQ